MRLTNVYYGSNGMPELFMINLNGNVNAMHHISELSEYRKDIENFDDIEFLPEQTLEEAYDRWKNDDSIVFEPTDYTSTMLMYHYLTGVKGFKEGYHIAMDIDKNEKNYILGTKDGKIHEYLLYNDHAFVRLREVDSNNNPSSSIPTYNSERTIGLKPMMYARFCHADDDMISNKALSSYYNTLLAFEDGLPADEVKDRFKELAFQIDIHDPMDCIVLNRIEDCSFINRLALLACSQYFSDELKEMFKPVIEELNKTTAYDFAYLLDHYRHCKEDPVLSDAFYHDKEIYELIKEKRDKIYNAINNIYSVDKNGNMTRLDTGIVDKLFPERLLRPELLEFAMDVMSRNARRIEDLKKIFMTKDDHKISEIIMKKFDRDARILPDVSEIFNVKDQTKEIEDAYRNCTHSSGIMDIKGPNSFMMVYPVFDDNANYISIKYDNGKTEINKYDAELNKKPMTMSELFFEYENKFIEINKLIDAIEKNKETELPEKDKDDIEM